PFLCKQIQQLTQQQVQLQKPVKIQSSPKEDQGKKGKEMTSVSDWTVLSGAAFSKLHFLTFFIFHIMVYAFNFVSHVSPPHPFIFHFHSLLFFEFFDFVYFS
ncbi:MAG: hypothetical protein ACK56I_14835, partial [bacterium]